MMKQMYRFWFLLTFGLFALASCKKEEEEIQDSGMIRTEQSILITKQSIPSEGGTIELLGTQSPLEGLKITVPQSSYDATQEFTIAYSNILEHRLGSYFNPATPLIEISNGGQLANRMMQLKIPVSANPDVIRNAFYYDRKSGELEGITILKQESNFITVLLRHFSLIVISEIRKDSLIKQGGFSTGFQPAVNGFSFRNWGTYPEPDGICAGMSIGAAYYYKNYKSSVNLYSYFQNKQLWFSTNDFWEDDSKGLKFATEIHQAQEIYWTNDNIDISEMLNAPQEDRFWNLIYSMQLNKQAQLIVVQDSRKDTSHMIVGFSYRFNGNIAEIKVYDPNYPAQESTIEFDLTTHTFKPYTSAANAQALEEGNVFVCDKISFVPLSSTIHSDDMDFLLQRVKNNTIGQGIFFPYKVYAVPTDNNFDRVELKSDEQSITNYIPFDEFNFVVEGIDASVGLKLAAYDFLPGSGIAKTEPAQTIKMKQKDTLLGLNLKATPAGQSYDKWIDFNWYKIQIQFIWIEPMDTTVSINSKLTLIARHNGTAPKNVRFTWDFGDGKMENATDSTITHIYKDPGDYDVTLRVVDLSNQKEVAKVETKVHVSIYPRIAIVLKGMDATPPSTIKADDGTDIPSIAWANKNILTAPNLSWNKTNFETDFQYSLASVVYTCRISGSLSEDFKKINFLNAIYTGILEGGDWNYQAAIIIQNFPLEEYIPGSIYGKALTGKDAQSKVTQLSWKVTTKDNQGNVKVQSLQSVDWNSTQTELSVYFYDR